MSEIKASMVGCIVATTLDGYIGYQNDLMITALIGKLGVPENIAMKAAAKLDIAHFSDITKSTKDKTKSVIMGRKTWESLPKKYQPLPDRINIVITSNDDYEIPAGVLKFRSIDEALETVEVDEAWLIGGAGVYDEARRFAHQVHICRFQVNALTCFDSFDLKHYGVSLPNWMKCPEENEYVKIRKMVPDSWQRYEIDIYEYKQKD